MPGPSVARATATLCVTLAAGCLIGAYAFGEPFHCVHLTHWDEAVILCHCFLGASGPLTRPGSPSREPTMRNSEVPCCIPTSNTAWTNHLNDPTSAVGTWATFTRRGLASGSGPFSDINGHIMSSIDPKQTSPFANSTPSSGKIDGRRLPCRCERKSRPVVWSISTPLVLKGLMA